MSKEEQKLLIKTPSFKSSKTKRFYWLYKYDGMLYGEQFQICVTLINPRESPMFQGGKLSAEIQYYGAGLNEGKKHTAEKELSPIEPGKSEEIIIRGQEAQIVGNAFLTKIKVTSQGKTVSIYSQDDNKAALTEENGFYFMIASREESLEHYRSRLILICTLSTFIVAIVTLIVIVSLS
jgi:hypothetical protein